MAVALDIVIQIVVTIAAIVALLWFGARPETAHAVKSSMTDKVATAILEAIFTFAAFVLYFGYFIVFEWRFAGRTPGKRLVGIRVVRDGGFPIDFTSSVVRNVVRIPEFALGFYAISAAATLLSPLNRRLGDMAAGTLVIRDSKTDRTATLPAYDRADDAPEDALARDLTPAERDLVRRYLDRRDSLGARARADLARRIAAGIRPRLAAAFEHLSDDDLLEHVARSSAN